MKPAIQNPHYKKIWEKVIINRHPEVKSLEEAFDVEKHHPDCLISIENGYILQTVGEMSINCKLKEFDRNKIQYSYVGRPITLEDILDALISAEIRKGASDVQISMITKTNGLLQIHVEGVVDTGEEPQIVSVGSFLYSLTNPLHEQTPETWEKIANLIN